MTKPKKKRGKKGGRRKARDYFIKEKFEGAK